MAWLNFNHYLFIACFMIVATLIFISVKFNKKIHKIKINPIDLVLGVIFFLSLWLFDLVSLKMVDNGINILVGITSETRISASIVYTLSIVGMVVIAYYYSVENKRVTRSKGYMKINKAFIYILGIGLASLIIFSIIMILYGASFTILTLDTLGLYHAALSFVILSMTLLLLDLN